MQTTASIDQLINEWLAEQGYNQATKKAYYYSLDLWCRYTHNFGNGPGCADRDTILKYREWMRKKGLSAYTINNRITIIKQFYKWLSDNRYSANYAAGIKLVRQSRYNNKRPLNEAQARNLLQSVNGETTREKRDKSIIELMLLNGLRACEVSRMNCEDLQGDYLFLQRKGHSSKDIKIRLYPQVKKSLLEYLSRTKQIRPQEKGNPIFVSMFRHYTRSRQIKRLEPQGISKLIKLRLVKAGIQDKQISCHSLRHTFGTFLVNDNVPLEEIKELMGHSSTATTEIYIRAAHEQRLLDNPPSFALAEKLLNN